jgi:hypothetical protein
MKAIEKHLNEIDRVEREIKSTKSWKRRNDLEKYRNRLKRELKTYIFYQNSKNT